MRERIRWYLSYRDEAGREHFTVWQVWLGRCFAIDDVMVGE